MGILLEVEVGITGGEDGVDNTDVPLEDLHSKPEEICQVYKELSPISDMFTVATAFGNVHGDTYYTDDSNNWTVEAWVKGDRRLAIQETRAWFTRLRTIRSIGDISYVFAEG